MPKSRFLRLLTSFCSIPKPDFKKPQSGFYEPQTTVSFYNLKVILYDRKPVLFIPKTGVFLSKNPHDPLEFLPNATQRRI